MMASCAGNTVRYSVTEELKFTIGDDAKPSSNEQ
jgi:hypothetical protein